MCVGMSAPRKKKHVFALCCVKSSSFMKLAERDQKPSALCFVVTVPSMAQNVEKTRGVFQRSRILLKRIRHTSEIMSA